MARQTDPQAAAPRTPLSKERVLRAAIQLADAEGIEALSMRRLAKELGVEAMSLYNHVANKGEILAGIIDLVAGEFDLPSDESDWKVAMRRNAISSRDVLLAHRWATSIWMTQGGGPARLRNGDWMLRTLREAGFSAELIYHAFHILESYVLGYTLQQLNFPYKGEELAGLAADFLKQIPVEDYPDLVEHIHQHIEPHDEETSGFELGLDLILDGLDRARANA
jgi:AcrR family transcriptional regulator